MACNFDNFITTTKVQTYLESILQYSKNDSIYGFQFGNFEKQHMSAMVHCVFGFKNQIQISLT